jgi:hypothetical protein
MYVITTITNNGYRCGCCSHTNDDVDYVETLEDALARMPTSVAAATAGNDTLSVEIRDGASGETIAEGTLTWYGSRSNGYRPTRWYGYTPDGKFDDFDGALEVEGLRETWAQVTFRLDADSRKRQAEKLEAEIKQKQTELDRLRQAQS